MGMMLRRLLTALFLMLLATGAARADNPFGIIVGSPAETADIVLARARGLGIAWYRPPAVFLNRWNPAAPCPLCAFYAGSGIRLALTVHGNGSDWPTHKPSTPPEDLAAYKTGLTSLLGAWKPALLVVENQENDPSAFVDSSGNFAGYIKQLDAACAVSHAKGIACANGGLTSRSVAAATWYDFLQRNLPDAACDYAKKAFYTEDDPEAGAPLCRYRRAEDVPATIRDPFLNHAPELLAQYKALPLDAVNFHWYVHDASALSQTVDYLRRATGKQVMCGEMGQWRWDAAPAHVRPLLRAAFASQMAVVIWYSVEGPFTSSLFEPDGRLRPAGWEFQRQLRGK